MTFPDGTRALENVGLDLSRDELSLTI